MSHSYLYILLLFSSVTLILSSPIAVIFDSSAMKNESKLILRSHAVILTEQYVLTTRFPLQLYNLTDLCVISQEQIDKEHINTTGQHFCKDIERSREADNYDLCVVELTKPLLFTYRVEVAPLPVLKKFLIGHGVQLDFFKGCNVIFNLRLDSKPDTFPYSMNLGDLEEAPYTSLILPKLEQIDIYVNLKKSKLDKIFCDSDNGMPLYCNHVVIGLFQFKKEGKNQSECASNKLKLVYVNLVNAIAQFFLKDFYETGPWPSTIAPNVTEDMSFASSTTEVPPK